MSEDIVAALTSSHRMMKHMLTLIRVQVDLLYPAADDAQFEFLSRAIAYMHSYPGFVHHPAEELIFERLVRYAPQMQPLCAHLVEQHRTFKAEETAILGHIPRARVGNGEACRRIKELGLAYCTQHIGHIDDEETDALPQAANWLCADDWREIGQRSNFELDPLSNLRTLARHDSLYDFIMATGPGSAPH